MKLILTLIPLIFILGIECFADNITTLRSLVEEASENNPKIKAVKSRWEASTKRPSQEGSLPNPIIGGKIKNVGFNEITLGEDPRSDVQVFFIQEIPFFGKLSLKEKVAKKEAEAKRWLSDSVTRRVLADLKEAYFEWFFANKSIEITTDNLNLLKKFTEIAEVKYKVGNGIQQDVIKAQVEVSSFIERLELLNKKLEIIEARIKSIISRPSDYPLGEPETVKKTPLELSVDEMHKFLKEQSPDLLARQELIASREKALSLARKQYLPDFIVEGKYYNRDGSGGDLKDIWEIGLGLRVPLYFWRKEKFGVEEAILELREVKEIYRSTNDNLLFDLNDKYITAKTAENLMELYETGIIPQATISLESALSGYQVGSVDFLTLLNNLITLFNFELEFYKQLNEHQIALARLEEITGVELLK